eukprot:EG_transcript_14787
MSTLTCTFIGTLIGMAAALLGIGLTAPATSAKLFAPATARTLSPTVAASALPRPALAHAQLRWAAARDVQPADLADSLIEETLSTSAQGPLAWFTLASVAGALGGLLYAKSTAGEEHTRLDVEGGFSRRQAMATGVAVVALGSVVQPRPAAATYGDAANVFGRKKESNPFFSAEGEGWGLVMPGKYTPSKEREYPGTVARWEDNFDTISCAAVVVVPGVARLGSLDDAHRAFVDPLLGQQAFEGDTISEGGFAPGRVVASALLGQSVVERNGKQYYTYELLTRTADGDEGGKHQLFSLAVSGGKLYILKHQVGDKRWFKGLDKPVLASLASFTVA